jgi:phosphoribosylformimino-5-aminoimidazole carboxamide ribotide isomerase
MSEETIFSEFPEKMAVKWFEQGAERLHIVDLDGAIGGRPVNRDIIRGVVDSVPIPIELGGGIRDIKTLEAYLELGIQYIILGTVAHKDPEFVIKACEEYPGKIILGIDAKDERVAVEGWTEETDLHPLEMAKKFESEGLSAIIYTDIQRDGMRTGPNIESTGALARGTSVPVIASGGISDISDISELMDLAGDGVIGMITGRAIYDGSLNLKDAIDVANGKVKIDNNYSED